MSDPTAPAPARRPRTFDRALRPAWPRKVMLEISDSCNHSCTFCAQELLRVQRRNPGPDFYLRTAQECYDHGSRVISLHGGYEPFSARHLESVIAGCARMGYEKIKVTTNGSLATPDRLRRCVEAGLTHLQFSINAGDADSYREVHGKAHFERVLSHLLYADRLRREHGAALHLSVSFVEVAENAGQLPALRERLGDAVDSYLFYGASNQNGQMPFDVPTKTERAPCHRPFDRVHVTAEGYLSACCGDYQNYLAVVDLAENPSVTAAFHSPPMVDLRRRHLEDDLGGTLCEKCIYNRPGPLHPLNPDLAVTELPVLASAPIDEGTAQ